MNQCEQRKKPWKNVKQNLCWTGWSLSSLAELTFRGRHGKNLGARGRFLVMGRESRTLRLEEITSTFWILLNSPNLFVCFTILKEIPLLLAFVQRIWKAKKKMKPTNPNAHTYVEDNDVKVSIMHIRSHKIKVLMLTSIVEQWNNVTPRQHH